MSDTFDQDHVNAITISVIVDCIHIVENYPNEYTEDIVREMKQGISVILQNNNLTYIEK